MIAELLKQGQPAVVEPFDELEFYNEYRRRLETKLDEKIKQIARAEHLLTTDADKKDQSLQASLYHALQEQDELKLLLDQIHKQLEKYSRAE
jgi:hypothetical protein